MHAWRSAWPAIVLAAAGWLPLPGPAQPRVPDALAGRLVVGYQGWFGCPGDLDGNTRWQHWFKGEPSPRSLLVDMLPATDGLPPSALCDTGLAGADGQPVRVFSSQTAAVVDRHFAWMRDSGLDTVALQRFVAELETPDKLRRADNVLRHVSAAAARHGIDFFISYDISGASPDSVIDTLKKDWRHVARELLALDSPAYLHARGRPVVQLWGFGFTDRPGQPQDADSLIRQFRQGGQDIKPAVLVGGVPSRWRSRTGDSRAEPAWDAVYRSFDVISPWLVGRFEDASGARRTYDSLTAPDLQEARRAGMGYLPVVFPGFSWHNLMAQRGLSRPVAQIPRRCGSFMWAQVALLLEAGADSLYVAMFDELDEGTALLPIEDRSARWPPGAALVRRSEAGCTAPADWYLRLAGRAAQHVKARSVPPAFEPPASR